MSAHHSTGGGRACGRRTGRRHRHERRTTGRARLQSGGHFGLRPHAYEDVTRAHEFLRERGIESELKEAQGDPAAEILAKAREGGYDLIAVGSRKRGAVARALLGSLSGELVQRASYPVLVAGTDIRERIEPGPARSSDAARARQAGARADRNPIDSLPKVVPFAGSIGAH
jgi:nucleotide-binding universal stress UspA family protein